MRRQQIVGIGLLLLTTGCLVGGIGRAADLPQTQPLPTQSWDDDRAPAERGPVGDVMIPVIHPPDAMVVAREPHGRRARRLDAALVRAAFAPAVNWVFFAVVIAF